VQVSVNPKCWSLKLNSLEKEGLAMLNQNPQKLILTVADLAVLLGKETKTLYNWKSDGKPMPPAYKIPGCKGERFLLDDVISWVRGFRVPDAVVPAKRGRPRKAVK